MRGAAVSLPSAASKKWSLAVQVTLVLLQQAQEMYGAQECTLGPSAVALLLATRYLPSQPAGKGRNSSSKDTQRALRSCSMNVRQWAALITRRIPNPALAVPLQTSAGTTSHG